jgi:O-antigen ligase
MRKISATVLLVSIAVSVTVMFLPDKWVSSVPEVISCVLAAVWTLYFSSGKEKPRLSFTILAVGLVVGLGAIQILFGTTVYRWATWLSVLYWLGNLSVLFSAEQALSDEGVRELFFRRLVLFGFVVAVVSSLQALTTEAVVYWTFPTRYAGWIVMGPFVYHNQYAAFVELILPIALYISFTDQAWRWLFLVAAATLYASVFIAGSRAGLILTTAELVVVPIVTIRSRKIPLAGFVGVGVLFAGMVILLAFSAGPDYLTTKFQIKDPYSIRREFLYSSLSMFRSRPWTGVGLGNWATAYPAYALFDDGSYANQAHNDWIQWPVEGGIPLLAIMSAVAIGKFPRAIRSGWGCGVAAVFLHCFVDYPLQRPAVAVVFFSILAAVSAPLPKNRAVRRPAVRDSEFSSLDRN